MRKILLVVVCCLAFAGCANYTETESTPTPTIFVEPESTGTPKPTKTPTPAPTATPTAEQKNQEEKAFKATCREYADNTYERLMREDTKQGTRICLKVSVAQKMDSLSKDSYRMTGMGSSWDDEYVIYDYREDDDTKILVGDTLIVYREFIRLGEFERSLTGNTVEIPIINAKYIDFENEDSEPTLIVNTTATPIPWVVLFNQSGEVFSEYDYNGELEGKARIDSISYEFDEWGDLIISLHGQVLEQKDDFYIKYRLYDDEDYVIDDGIIGINGLKSGDKFKNKKTIIHDIDKGNYRLELSDR